MGRRVKTDISQAACPLIPQWHFLPDFQQKDEAFKVKQKKNYDRQHHVRTPDPLLDDSPVWVTTAGNN